MKHVWAVVVAGCISVAAVGNDVLDGGGLERPLALMQPPLARLLTSTRALGDWDVHYELLMASLEKVYARNGWDAEPDAFSLDLLREVNAIPPWSPLQRLDKLVEVVGDRYLLDPEQEAHFRAALTRDVAEILTRHAGRIVEYVGDAVQTRVSGDAFTPERVARWVQLSAPVFQDVRRRVNETAREFMSELNDDQRHLAQSDLDALNRRLAGIEQLSQRWVRGDWQPSDWGLEDDPIQLAAAGRGIAATDLLSKATPRRVEEQPSVDASEGSDVPANSGTASVGAANSPGSAPIGAHDDVAPPPRRRLPRGHAASQPAVVDADPWALYVRQFIQKYKLDESQQERAWRFYRDVKPRADKCRALYAERLDAAQRRAAIVRDENAQDAPHAVETERATALRRWFDQLERRLARLPTRAQRQNAETFPLGPPPDVARLAPEEGQPPAPPVSEGP